MCAASAELSSLHLPSRARHSLMSVDEICEKQELRMCKILQKEVRTQSDCILPFLTPLFDLTHLVAPPLRSDERGVRIVPQIVVDRFG